MAEPGRRLLSPISRLFGLLTDMTGVSIFLFNSPPHSLKETERDFAVCLSLYIYVKLLLLLCFFIYNKHQWMWPICSAAKALSSFRFSPYSITCRLGHYLCDRVINRPIRGQGKGLCWGGGGDVWQLAVNDPCSSSLSIQTSTPPTCFSRVSPDNSWVTFSCRWEYALFYLHKQWASLDRPFGSAHNEIYEGEANSLILISEMMCMAFWHPYQSACSQISSDTSRISWCSCILLTKCRIVMLTCVIDVHDFLSWMLVFFIQYVCIQSIRAAQRLNTGVW